MTFQATDKTNTFTGIYDYQVYKELALELWNRDVPEILWLRVVRDERNVYDNDNNYWDNPGVCYDWFSTIDKLYNEHVDKKYHDPIAVKVFIKKVSQEQNLKKLGIIEDRKLEAKFLVAYMEKRRLPLRAIGIGDIIEYQGHIYSIDTIMPEFASEWISSGVPQYIVCKLNTVDRNKI